jgi:hypothetical protein
MCNAMNEVGMQIIQVGNFEHPPYSPTLLQGDYHIFLQLNKFFASHSLRSDQEKKDMHDYMKCI